MNAMGGVGLLFALANYQPPSTGSNSVAFIEFSTGDLNLGLTPLGELPSLLHRLLSMCRRDHRYTVLIHNWRADQPDDDAAGVRRIYDELARKFDFPVVQNHVMARECLETQPELRAQWFRDVCHTHPAGAAAYAVHIEHCLQALESGPEPATMIDAGAHPAGDINFLSLADPFAQFPGGDRGSYTYPGTGQSFETVTVPAGARVRFEASGRLLGVGFVSGPRSGWTDLRIDGHPSRRFRCFDRHSHYARYILLPAVFDLVRAQLELCCADEPFDRHLAAKAHADFDLPRQLCVIHLVGSGLSVRTFSLEPA